MLRQLLTTAAIAALSLSASAQEPQKINDLNTPLHLMQPKYDTPYGIPQEAEVKATIDRVLTYLEDAMPTAVTDNKLPVGSFRLTSYEAGVLYSAAINAAKATGDQHYLLFAKERLALIAAQSEKEQKALKKDPAYDAQMRMVLFPGALDDCGAMCTAYLRLGESGIPNYKSIVDRYSDFVINKQYRMSDGIFARHRPHRNTVWLDDMYMGVPCLAWSGHIDDAVKQIRLFKEKMWVPEKKLFRHGWVEDMSVHPAYHWGRANGWAILTMCEVLDAMPKDHKDRNFVLDLLRQHLEGLCALQDMTGYWHQLLDRPDTYLETSCTSIYTYCIAHAINEGWVDAVTYGAQALLGWQASQKMVNAQGQVEGTCVGTGMGFDPAFYAYRPVHKMAAHGYGPMIWAGAEIIRMLKTTHPKMNDSAVHFYPTEQKTDKPIFYESATGEEILW